MNNVKFITCTPEAEKVILYCARVSSNNQNSENTKLLSYCIKHKHWSIFQQASMTLEITTSRAISAQILRHKMSPQEFSQRYAEVLSFENYEARRQDITNRQNSIDDFDEQTKQWFRDAQYKVQQLSSDLYEQALERGIAKECCRFLLPMSSTTKIYLTGDLRNWIHYIDVRTGVETQLEHREIAIQVREIFKEKFPIIAEACGY